jgi:hypothetical protein
VTPRPSASVADTHYVRHGTPGGRLKEAVCGRLIDDRRDSSVEPTCPQCKTWIAEFESLEVE